MEENELNENEQELDEEKQKATTIKKTFWDINFSWLLVILLALIAILIGNTNVSKVIKDINNSVLYILLEVLLSLLFGVIFYGLGKIVFGLLSGYNLGYVELFGAKFYKKNGKLAVKKPSSFWALADFKLVMNPKNEKSNPKLMLFGGTIAVVVFQAIMVLIGFIIKNNGSFGNLFHISTLFGSVYIMLIVLYQLIPLRTDNLNDGFLLIKCKSAEDKVAYNLSLKNKTNDVVVGEIVTGNFTEYQSYAKANYIRFEYLNALYNNELERAVELMDKAMYISPLMTFDNLVKVKGEKIFLLVLAGENEEADKTFRSYTHDERVDLEKPKELGDCRIALVVSGIIETEFEACKKIIKLFNKIIAETENNKRVEKEKVLFEKALEDIKKVHPDWNLDDLDAEPEYEEEEYEEPEVKSSPKVKENKTDEDDDEDDDEYEEE